MFRVAFVFLVATYGLDSSPSPRPVEYILKYLKNCSDDASNVIQCTEEVGKLLSHGVPELNIPQYKPHYNFHRPYRHTYNEVFVGNATIKHIKVHGISEYIIKTIKFGMTPELGLRISISAHYAKLVFNAISLLNGTLHDLLLNVKKDQVKMTLKHFDVDIVLEGHFYFPRKGDKKYFKLNKVRVMKIILGFTGFNLKRNHNNVLNDLQSAYVQNNGVLLWKQIIPDFLVGITTFVQTIANKVFDNFPAQQLFHSNLGAQYSF